MARLQVASTFLSYQVCMLSDNSTLKFYKANADARVDETKNESILVMMKLFH